MSRAEGITVQRATTRALRAPGATTRAELEEQLTPVFTVDAPSYAIGYGQRVGRWRRCDYVVGRKDDEESAFDDGNQNAEQRIRP